jgi:hypothetical protein
MPKITQVMERLARRTVEAPCLVKGLHPKCWVWQGAKSEGYGSIATTSTGNSRRTHAVAYESLVGQIPDGLKLIHLCTARACWNPAHLKPATQTEVAAHYDTGRIARLRKDTKTHCIHGHEFTPENSGRTDRGQRFCRTCRKDGGARWHEEWIAKVPNPPRTKDSRAVEAAQCRRLREQGAKVKEIAQLLGLAESTVYERLKPAA